MLVCRCPDYDTPKCFGCVHSNTHLGDVPSRLNETLIKAAYIKGAVDYGGIIVLPEEINIEDLLQEIT